jgi:hypothetical protein
MRHFSFDQLSQRYLPVKIEVVGGSRPRLTLEHELTGKKYFLKSYRHNTREVWAEMLASKLGEVANIDIQAVSLKKLPKHLVSIFRGNYKDYLPSNWQPVGALVTNIFPKGHEQLYGSQIIGTASDPVSLQTIESSIRATYLDTEDLLQKFADMVVFDAWIGNMDRHHENWAITQTSISQQLRLFRLTKSERDALKSKRQFTQLFDHGSSLLFELGEEKVEQYLADRKLFIDQYIVGKKYALLLGVNDESLNVFDILLQNIEQKTNWRPRVKKSIDKILAADSLKVSQLILQMPTDGELDYSAPRKSLLYFSLEERKSILKNMRNL